MIKRYDYAKKIIERAKRQAEQAQHTEPHRAGLGRLEADLNKIAPEVEGIKEAKKLLAEIKKKHKGKEKGKK